LQLELFLLHLNKYKPHSTEHIYSRALKHHWSQITVSITQHMYTLFLD